MAVTFKNTTVENVQAEAKLPIKKAFYMSREMSERLKQFQTKTGATRSEVMRRALDAFLKAKSD